MYKVVIIVAVLILGVVGFTLLPDSSSATKDAPDTQFSAIQQDITSGAMLYDVRTAQEFEASHFKNAVNFPVQDLEAGNFPDIDKQSKIYVYCQSGNRSAQATKLLNDAGYTNVTDLGGLQDVKNLGGTL